MSLNRIVVQGNLTRDVEIRRTNSGSAVGSFSVAVQRDFVNKQTGEKETDFIDVTVFGKTAEFVGKYFSKGSQAIVEGSLQIQEWVDKEGNKRKTPQIVATNVYFCGKKSSDSGSVPNNNYSNHQNSSYDNKTQQQPAYGSFSNAEEDGNLPF